MSPVCGQTAGGASPEQVIAPSGDGDRQAEH